MGTWLTLFVFARFVSCLVQCCLIGAGVMTYHILFLQHKLGRDPIQFSLPLVMMTITIVLSVIKSIDDMATFAERKYLQRKQAKKAMNQYVKV